MLLPAEPRPEYVDAAREGEPDDVVHGQEVLGEAQLLDDLELALQARGDLGGERPVALLGALEAELAEQRVGRLCGRQRVGGEEELPQAQVEVAARGEAGGVAVGLGAPAEEVAHLRRRLEVQLGVLAPQGVGQRLVGGLGGEHVVQGRVGLGDVVHVVGGHGGQAQLVGEQVELAQVAGRVGQQLVLQLDDEVARAEDAAETGGGAAGAGAVAGQRAGADLAAPAGREGDEVARVGGDRLEAGQRRLAGVLEVGGADDAAEVAPAGVVAGQQHEVVAAGRLGGRRRHRGGGLEVRDAGRSGRRLRRPLRLPARALPAAGRSGCPPAPCPAAAATVISTPTMGLMPALRQAW